MKHKIVYTLIALAIVGMFATMTVQAPATKKKDEFLMNYNFKVEIEGITVGVFRFVEGLSCETEVTEYREVGGLRVKYLPGVTRCGPVILKQGMTKNTELWNWYETVQSGRAEHKTISIILLNSENVEQRRWTLYECFPVRWSMSSLDGKGNDVLTEEMVITVEYFEEA